jgi:hypothetical protein
MVAVAWRVAGGKFRLTVAKPAGLPAAITAPNGATREFTGARFEEEFDLS